MRRIHEFTVKRQEDVEEVELSKDAEGNEVKKTKKVKKDVEHKFFIKRPNRIENDEAEMFRAAAESDCVQRGIMTSALLAKRLLNDGGILTDEQRDAYNKLQQDFFDKQPRYVELTEKEESKRSKAEKEEVNTIMEELTDIMQSMQELENASSTLYNRTAEAIARTKTVVWLTLHLAYEDVKGKEVPFFGEGEYNEKIAQYDIMEEKEDPYEYEVIQKFMLLIGSWYTGKAITKDDFDLLLSVADRNSPL